MEPPVGRDALREASCSSMAMSSRNSSLAPPCCSGSGGIATLKRVLAAPCSAAACPATACSVDASSSAACSAAGCSAVAEAAFCMAARSTAVLPAFAISRWLRLRWLSTAGPITRSQTAKLLRWRFTNCAYAAGCATKRVLVWLAMVEHANRATATISTSAGARGSARGVKTEQNYRSTSQSK